MKCKIKTSTRLLACLLALWMLLSSVPLSAFAAQPVADLDEQITLDVDPDLGESLYLNSEQALQLDTSDVIFKKDDKINVIVQLDETGLLTLATQQGMTVAAYLATAEGKNVSNRMKRDQDEMIEKLGDILLDVRYRYTTVFNGFSAEIAYGDLAVIENVASVDRVMISEKYLLPEEAVENDTNVYQTGIFDASTVGYTGKGTTVAVLDTGLDYHHSAFANAPAGELALTQKEIAAVLPELSATASLTESEYTAKDLAASDLYLSEKVPFAFDYADNDPDVYPSSEHGTHVAGIIAGSDDEITGVAVDAQLVIMKVFGNVNEGAQQDTILAALSDALLLNVDAINMSLGSSCGFARAADDTGINEVYDAIRDSGICLQVAASNSYSSAKGGKDGDTAKTEYPDTATIGSPATYDAAFSVASVSGQKTNYLMANGEREIYFAESNLSAVVPGDFIGELIGDQETLTLPYVVVPGIGNDGNYSTVDVKGKIAVVKRGVTTFEEKVRAAEANGAIACIIYNNVSGVINMTVGSATDIPSCSVNQSAGTYFEEHPTGTLLLSPDNEAGPFMSDFSSWGPNSDLQLNPDITSYGGEIYSAVPGGYEELSGTSMACPNMSGIVLLVRQYLAEQYPDLDTVELRNRTYQLLMSTATILYNESGTPYSPRKQGAGLGDVIKALSSSAFLSVTDSDRTKLSLGHDPDKTGIYTLTFNIENMGGSVLSWRVDPLVMTEGLSDDGKTVSEIAYLLDDTAVELSIEGGAVNGNVITVAGYGQATLTVTLTLSEDAKAYLNENFENGMYVEGFVRLISLDRDADLSIPYLAFYGDWTQAPLLDVTEFEVGEEQKDPSILEDEKLKPDIYATVPLAGFMSGSEMSYYYMGKVGYILADGYESPAVLEDYCSLTTSKKGQYTLYAISAGLLRNARTVDIKIVNADTGDEVFTTTSEFCRKSYYVGAQVGGYVDVAFDVSEAKLANNTKYTFSMVCYLDWEGEQHNLNNTFSFSFYIDDEAPVLLSGDTYVKVSKDNASGVINNYELNMYVYDNHYIQGYYIYTYDEVNAAGTPVEPKPLISGMIPCVGDGRGLKNEIKLNITRYWEEIMAHEGRLYVTFYDYARNTSSFTMKLEPSQVTEVNIKSGRNSTADGDDIVFTLNPGEQLDLSLPKYLELAPLNHWTQDILWSTSDESIVTVSNGTVTAVSAGEATITAKASEHATEAATASVTIRVTSQAPASQEIKLKGLVLNYSSLLMERGEKRTVQVTVQPYNVTNQPELIWSTVSPYIRIDVDPEDQTKATITALASGTATFSVKVDGTYVSTNCRVTVEDEYEYTGQLLEGYNGRGDENGVVEIPADKNFTYIGRLAFYDNDYITKVVIPEGVKEIQYGAFYGCDNLTTVVLPESCTLLDEWAFGYCPKLKSVNLENVQNITQLAFYADSSLDNIRLDKCLFIGERAFSFCTSLTSVDLSPVSFVDKFAFVQCTSLTSVALGEKTPLSAYVFALCTALTEVDIYNPTVGQFAFYGSSRLSRVTFHAADTEIDQGAFYQCSSLRTVTFPNGCRLIGDTAFGYCTSLREVTIPAGLEVLGPNAFAACLGLKTVTVSKDSRFRVTGTNPFYYCISLTEFSVESGSKYFTANEGILYDKSMKELVLVPYKGNRTSLDIPESVIRIGNYAFSTVTGINTVHLNNVQEIGEGAFRSARVVNVNGGEYVEVIDDYAFCAAYYIKHFTLGDRVRKIGDHAFDGCNSLEWGDLVLPDSLTEWGEFSFCYNYGLKTVSLPSGVDTLPDATFYNCTKLTDISIPANIQRIGEYALDACEALTEVTIPETVKELGIGIFVNCIELTDVTIGTELSTVPEYMFYGCTKLENLVLNGKIEKVDPYAFYDNEKLTSFDFSELVEAGEAAFYGTALTEVNAPKLVTVGDHAFNSCESLAKVSLPVAETVGYGAFYECGALDGEVLALPLVTKVGGYAFAYADALKTISLPGAVEIGEFAFAQTTALESISIPLAEELGQYVFYRSGLKELTLPATLKKVDPLCLAQQTLTSLNVDEENELFFADGTTLYRHLKTGGYELISYSTANESASYTVLDGTVRLNIYAFGYNEHLESVTLPRTLTAIGAYAFYDCTELSEVIFRSVNAPMLESMYSVLFGSAFSYYNFIGRYGTVVHDDITMIAPANGVGYDNYLWTSYVGGAALSGDVEATASTLYLMQLIDELDREIVYEDAEQIAFIRRIYNAMDSVQRGFVTNLAIFEEAERQLSLITPPDDGEETTPPPTGDDEDETAESDPSTDTSEPTPETTEPTPETTDPATDQPSASETDTDTETHGEGDDTESGCGSVISATVLLMAAVPAGCLAVGVKTKKERDSKEEE